MGFHGRIQKSGLGVGETEGRSLRVSRSVGNDLGQYRARSTAANGDHDFDLVAVGQRLGTVAAARHDFAVALERDAFAGEIQALEQLQAVERLLEAVRRAVYRNQHHSIQFAAIRAGREFLQSARVFATATAACRAAGFPLRIRTCRKVSRLTADLGLDGNDVLAHGADCRIFAVNMALAGLVLLVIGDSHMVSQGYLISSLHESLVSQRAIVHSYGACGVNAGDWVYGTSGTCGQAERHERGAPRIDYSSRAKGWTVKELIERHRPDLIVVQMGDTMAGYGQSTLPQAWIYGKVRALTTAIRTQNVACI